VDPSSYSAVLHDKAMQATSAAAQDMAGNQSKNVRTSYSGLLRERNSRRNPYTADSAGNELLQNRVVSVDRICQI
jgi:hypothetical protein